MAISKEVLDRLLIEHKGPDNILAPERLVKQLSKALIKRAMQTEITGHLGYEKTSRRKETAYFAFYMKKVMSFFSQARF